MPVLMGDDDGSWRRGSTEEGQLEGQLEDMRFERDCARATIAEQDKRILALTEQLAEARKHLDAHNDADRLYAIPSIQDTLSDDVKETHHALLSDDVVFLLLSRLAQWDGIGAAAACKIWQSQWKRRCAGMLRLARHRVGAFRSCDHVVANPGGGVIVSDYHKSRLEIFSPEGESQGAFVAGSDIDSDFDDAHPLYAPSAVALLGDEHNTAWVISEELELLVCMRLGDVRGGQKIITSSDHIATPATEVTMKLCHPKALALSPGGEFLLVLHGYWIGEVLVVDSLDGTLVGSFGFEEDDTFGNLHSPHGLAVHGNYCFVTDTYNQRICVFNWCSQTWVRCFGRRGAFIRLDDEDPEPYWLDSKEIAQELDATYEERVATRSRTLDYEDERKGTGPGEFIEPFGIATHGNTLYVSELAGCRIQVMRLPENILDLSSEPQVLQIIPAPGGQRLGGLCVDGERLWCVGPHYIHRASGKKQECTYVSLFSPIKLNETRAAQASKDANQQGPSPPSA